MTDLNHINHLKIWTRILPLLLWLIVISGCSDQQKDVYNNSQSPESSNQSNQQTPQTNSIDPAEPTHSFTILALGDSLTEGLGVKQDSNYPALLQKALHQNGFPHIKVINSGLSGETSSGLKNRLDWVLQLEPDLTILNIGANDAIRGLPLNLTHNNIDNIIQQIKDSGSEVMLAGMQIYDNLGNEYVSGFKNMYPTLAKKHDLTMIPFFLDHVGGVPQYNQADMIHPTKAGYDIIVKRNIMPTLLPLLNQLTHAKTTSNVTHE